LLLYVAFAGFLPQDEWDRCQSDSLLIHANELYEILGRRVYIYLYYRVTILKMEANKYFVGNLLKNLNAFFAIF